MSRGHPGVISAHPRVKAEAAQIGFQPIRPIRPVFPANEYEPGDSDSSRDGVQWPKQQAGSLFYIAIRTVTRCPEAI
jgi:hypothetical protein